MLCIERISESINEKLQRDVVNSLLFRFSFSTIIYFYSDDFLRFLDKRTSKYDFLMTSKVYISKIKLPLYKLSKPVGQNNKIS